MTKPYEKPVDLRPDHLVKTPHSVWSRAWWDQCDYEFCEAMKQAYPEHEVPIKRAVHKTKCFPDE